MTLKIIAATHDLGNKCMYLYITKNEPVRTVETKAGLLIDFDKDNQIVGFELLDAYSDRSHALFTDVLHALGSRIWEAGFIRAHEQHAREDTRLSRRTPAIACDNPYETKETR